MGSSENPPTDYHNCMIAYGVTTSHRELALKCAPRILLQSLPGDKQDCFVRPARATAPRRSRRQSVKDYLIGVTLLRPWRCRSCDLRFYAWAAPLAYVPFVHCAMCGNMDLQRISSEHGAGAFRLAVPFASFSRLPLRSLPEPIFFNSGVSANRAQEQPPWKQGANRIQLRIREFIPGQHPRMRRGLTFD